jgi:nicotinamide-nucleotide amidase
MNLHSSAAVLSTGDEIILGQLQDSNARWIAQRLVELGVKPVEICGVGDDLSTLAEAIRRLARRAPVVIMSGGLGPTDGDLTRPALACVLGQSLVLDEQADKTLHAKLAARGRAMTERLRRQAFRPEGATCLANEFGTAPGLHAVLLGAGPHGDTDVFCLPGPPGELRPMFEREVLPRLRPDPARRVRTKLLQVCSLAESDAVARMGELTKRDRNPLVGVTASGGQLTVRIRHEGPEGDGAAAEAMAQAERAVRDALGPHVFAAGERTLASAVLDVLAGASNARGGCGRTLAVVESCTGGVLASLLTDVPGSSAVFQGGWLTYANELKVREVGIDAGLIERDGAVSEPVARAMAVGGLRRAGVDHALAVTGIAGPGGGVPSKPVGLVYVAHAWRPQAGGGVTGPEAVKTSATSGGALSSVASGGGAVAGDAARGVGEGVVVDVRRLVIPGDRAEVRARAARAALSLVWFWHHSRPPGEPRLLWESAVTP